MKNVLLAALLLASIVALILGSAARFGYFPVNAVATPPRLEVTLNQSILQASLSNQAKGLTNPLQPNSDVLLAGMKVFKMNCAGCHGQPGKPSSWGTKGFYPRVPQFADDPPPLAAAEMFVAIKYGEAVVSSGVARTSPSRAKALFGKFVRVLFMPLTILATGEGAVGS